MGTSKGKKAQGRHGNLPEAPFPLGPLGENKRFRERKPEECIEEAGEVPREAQGPGSSNKEIIIAPRKTHTVGTVHTQEKRLGVWLPELGNHLPGDRGMRRTFR